jgi:hypothetical protein
MDVLDPRIRRSLQIASYQRDELFYRSPNIIPTSLKMLVEPTPSDRTTKLLATVHDEPFAVAGATADTHGCGDTDTDADANYGVTRSMDELVLAAEKINILREKYRRVHSAYQSRARAKSSAVDATVGNLDLDLSRLNRVKDYYKDLIVLNQVRSGVAAEKLCSRSPELETRHDCDRDIELIEALKHVSWR